jgi:hypothetical protein
MGVFKKQGVYWIDYYVSGRRKWERIGAEKNLAEAVWSGGRRSRILSCTRGRFGRKTTACARYPRRKSAGDWLRPMRSYGRSWSSRCIRGWDTANCSR